MEHKSFPDRKTVIQLKHYINSIENDITDSEKYEGPIPVVIYHGRRKWNITLKLNLDEAGSALNRHFSILEYILVDISHTPDDRIVGSPQLRMTLMALKYVKTRLLIKKIDSILVIIKEMIDEPDAGEYVESLLLYIDSAAASDFKDEILEKVKRSIIIGDDKMSKIKEYFKEEGRKEGVKQGIEQGINIRNEQIAINMLRKGEPGEKVALYTGLPAERIALLRKQLLK